MKTPARSLTIIIITLVALLTLIGLVKLGGDNATTVVGKASAASLHTHTLTQLNMPDESIGKLFTSQQLVKIMPLGDSITEGVNSSFYGGYRVSLWNDAVASGWHVQFVGSRSNGPTSLPDKAHEGHPGWRTDQISTHVVKWLTTYQPQIILLHIGTNDIIQGYSVSTAIMRLNYLIDQITHTLPSAIVIVAAITPLRRPGLASKVQEYNQDLVTLIREKQAVNRHILAVDMYDAMPLNDITDTIHPNDAGYTIMAQVWYKALTQLFIATPTNIHLFA